jgi:hypothetical protein
MSVFIEDHRSLRGRFLGGGALLLRDLLPFSIQRIELLLHCGERAAQIVNVTAFSAKGRIHADRARRFELCQQALPFLSGGSNLLFKRLELLL